MKQYNEFFRMIFNKHTLAKIGLLLCLIILAYMLILRQQTLLSDYAVIYICLVFSIICQFYFFRIPSKKKYQNIIFLFSIILVLVIISGEILLILFGFHCPYLWYGRFVHFTIRGTGVVSVIICFLCITLKNKNHKKNMFNFSYIILVSSVFVMSMLQDASYTMTDEFWWKKYALMGGVIIAIGILNSIYHLAQMENNDSK